MSITNKQDILNVYIELGLNEVTDDIYNLIVNNPDNILILKDNIEGDNDLKEELYNNIKDNIKNIVKLTFLDGKDYNTEDNIFVNRIYEIFKKYYNIDEQNNT